VTIDPQQLAIAITSVGAAIVGLVVWLQRHQNAQVREQLDAMRAGTPSGELRRLAEEMGAERAARGRLAEQVSALAIDMARVSTDVRWLRRRIENGAVSIAPEGS